MITESSIYWILKLDDINSFLIAVTVFAGFMAIASMLCFAIDISIEGSDTYFGQMARKTARRFTVLALLVGVALCFTPTTKQMAMIKVIPAIANSEIVGEMSADAKEIYRMGINAIKEALSEKKEQCK